MGYANPPVCPPVLRQPHAVSLEAVGFEASVQQALDKWREGKSYGAIPAPVMPLGWGTWAVLGSS